MEQAIAYTLIHGRVLRFAGIAGATIVGTDLWKKEMAADRLTAVAETLEIPETLEAPEVAESWLLKRNPTNRTHCLWYSLAELFCGLRST